jgi:hypothetical protein
MPRSFEKAHRAYQKKIRLVIGTSIHHPITAPYSRQAALPLKTAGISSLFL